MTPATNQMIRLTACLVLFALMQTCWAMTYSTATFVTYGSAVTPKGLALRSDGNFYTIIGGKLMNFVTGVQLGTTTSVIALAAAGTHIYTTTTSKIQRDTTNWVTTAVVSSLGANATYGKFLC